ncbi:hypothetical protein I7I48_08910 [Histoplasma ohiense]|nr:hypothetical protein I7I48_08910 [Histoplasma ohiense (nom. inval.)]
MFDQIIIAVRHNVNNERPGDDCFACQIELSLEDSQPALRVLIRSLICDVAKLSNMHVICKGF